VSIGAVILAKLGDFNKALEDQNVHAPPIVFIALGGVVFIIAFFGCCGAVRESYCMTTTVMILEIHLRTFFSRLFIHFQYAFLMMTLIVLQIIVAVFIFLYIGDVTTAIKALLEKVFNEPSVAGNQEVIDVIQRELQCCKFNGPIGLAFDQSCCPTSDLPCTLITAYKQGCGTAFVNFFESLGKTLGYVAIGVAGVQVSC
jgi:CD63 antigen